MHRRAISAQPPQSDRLWMDPPSQLSLRNGEIHVWRAPLYSPDDRLKLLAATLSTDELARASRFYFDRHRNEYVTARGTLRAILGRYLHCGPETLRFAYSALGKPEIDGPDPRIRFNISHSGAWLLIAVSSFCHLGVDVEEIRTDWDLESLAAQFFSKSENKLLSAAERERWHDLFFACWTSKEAYVKGTGEGLSLPTTSFDVAIDVDGRSRLIETRLAPNDVEKWSIVRLECDTGYKAALAVESQAFEVRQWDWHWT